MTGPFLVLPGRALTLRNPPNFPNTCCIRCSYHETWLEDTRSGQGALSSQNCQWSLQRGNDGSMCWSCARAGLDPVSAQMAWRSSFCYPSLCLILSTSLCFRRFGLFRHFPSFLAWFLLVCFNARDCGHPSRCAGVLWPKKQNPLTLPLCCRGVFPRKKKKQEPPWLKSTTWL